MTKESGIGYLGSEFLLWLFWKSATDETMSLNNLGLGEISVFIEMALSSGLGML